MTALPLQIGDQLVTQTETLSVTDHNELEYRLGDEWFNRGRVHAAIRRGDVGVRKAGHRGVARADD